MGDDEYEILPHTELEYLRKEVERLKQNPFGDTQTGENLLDAMNNLSANVNKLVSILETANDEIIKDYEENKQSDRLDRLNEQNEKLAEGIVAIGHLVKELKEDQKRSKAYHGGFEELSDFSTSTTPKKQPQKPEGTNNPFADTVMLDQELPRQSFKNMDSQEDEELPSTKNLPPPPPKEGANEQALPDDAPKPQ